ncbi:MAG: ABC transporter ATP-binding protein [Candidatus Thermoplasmatota archaeon]|nr:ABC transporter ATP-binding protein [Candidatus Thermoplasmatota archaeon]
MLRARALYKAYRGPPVVRNVSLDLAPGRIVGLVGSNGAGKTTTIKMLSGLVEPSQGTVTLDEEPTLDPEVRRRIGFLPENSPLYEEETPLSYLRFFASIYGISNVQAGTRARELLTRLDLDEEHWERTIGTFSKGMRRKVAIARAVLHDPDVLIFDEPTSGLDPLTEHDLNGFMTELAEQGKAILLSAHNLRQVETLCDEIIIMHNGEVATHGTLDELRGQWGQREYRLLADHAFTGSHGSGHGHEATFHDIRALEDALEEVRRAGGMVLEIESLAPQLEDILVATARS